MDIKKMFTLFTSAVIGVTAVLPLFGESSVYAQPADGVLKDVYANYFRIGTAWQWRNGGFTNTQMRETILREFNSLTHEDDLKPNATMVRAGSTDSNIQVTLNSNARMIMQFCVDNKISLRGHTLVWHSQTPDWFFHANMQSGNNNALASQSVMLQRMESYIKNILELIKQEFPSLNLYAYDVLNEIFLDNGNPRQAGFGGDNSPWVSIFGNSHAWVDSAFTYARRHSATTFPDMKLFYNDFNEYQDGKRNAMVALATRLGPSGLKVLDGLGMQSHLSTSYPDIARYTQALTAFTNVPDIEVSVTELDVTIEGSANEATQATIYRGVFQALINAKKSGANITSVTLWGVTDDRSWRAERNPLVFNAQFEKKPAYDSIVALIPEAEWGDGSNFGIPPGHFTVMVSASPSIGGNVTKTPNNTSYSANATVTLTAEPANGFRFDGWDGNFTTPPGDTGDSISVSVDKNLIVTAKFVPTSDGTINLIKDGNFPGTSLGSNWSWNVGEHYGNSAGTNNVSDGKVTVTITTPGEHSYQPQLIQQGISLDQGISYRLTFNASAGVARELEVGLQQSSSPWGTYIEETFELAATESEHTLEFTMIQASDPNVQLSFNVGGPGTAGTSVTISDVRLIHISTSNVVHGTKVTSRVITPSPVTVRGRTLIVNNMSPDERMRIRVVNIAGKTLASFNAKGGSNLSLRRLPAGAYIIEMQRGRDGAKTTSQVVLR